MHDRVAPDNFQKVFDGRNQRIRGLWVRNDRFYMRIAAENQAQFFESFPGSLTGLSAAGPS